MRGWQPSSRIQRGAADEDQLARMAEGGHRRREATHRAHDWTIIAAIAADGGQRCRRSCPGLAQRDQCAPVAGRPSRAVVPWVGAPRPQRAEHVRGRGHHPGHLIHDDGMPVGVVEQVVRDRQAVDAHEAPRRPEALPQRLSCGREQGDEVVARETRRGGQGATLLVVGQGVAEVRGLGARADEDQVVPESQEAHPDLGLADDRDAELLGLQSRPAVIGRQAGQVRTAARQHRQGEVVRRAEAPCARRRAGQPSGQPGATQGHAASAVTLQHDVPARPDRGVFELDLLGLGVPAVEIMNASDVAAAGARTNQSCHDERGPRPTRSATDHPPWIPRVHLARRAPVRE